MSYYTDRTDYFKKTHRCVRCGKKDESTESGNQRCYTCIEKGKISQKKWYRNHIEQVAQAQKERREHLKAHGVCIICAKEKAIPEQTMCKSCRKLSRERNRKYHTEKVIENG